MLIAAHLIRFKLVWRQHCGDSTTAAALRRQHCGGSTAAEALRRYQINIKRTKYKRTRQQQKHETTAKERDNSKRTRQQQKYINNMEMFLRPERARGQKGPSIRGCHFLHLQLKPICMFLNAISIFMHEKMLRT